MLRDTEYFFPKSSFLSVEKDLDTIIDKMLKDDRLKKLLFYTTPDALRRPVLSDAEAASLIGNNIKIVPKLYIDDSVLCYVIISFDGFVPNNTNPQFRNNLVTFDIVCHFNQWNLEGLKLRPYQIAAEIDTLFKGKSLSNIGELEFAGMNQIVLNDEYAGLSLGYLAIHDGEDKHYALDPADEAALNENFRKIYDV